MLSVLPFKGLLYNPDKVKDLSRVVAPPYDVISEEERNFLCKRDPYNVVRLILSRDDSNSGKDRYQKAEETFNEWVNRGILIRDKAPAIYAYQQTYTLNNETSTRNGFIALMRLEEFGAGGAIYPHEKTLAKPKADRLRLIEACGAHFSCVFSLYQDPADEIDRTLLEGRKDKPIIEINDDKGINNRLWRVNDPDVLEKMERRMSSKSLLIADGHHRYETALRYRDIMRGIYPDYTGDEAFNFVMMYFSNMDGEGFSVLPTHRLIHSIEGFDPVAFLSDSAEFFDIEDIKFNDESEPAKRKVLIERLKEKKETPAFGLYLKGENVYRLLTLKDIGIMDKWVNNGISPESKTLDLTVLHTLVLKGIMGVDEGRQERQENIDYFKDTDKAIEAVKEGKHRMAFILSPPEITKIKAISMAGEKMPQKSTFFYPKLLTGLVINPVISDERPSF
ncbi:MAG: DUF1015 domain-containing protein [Thermodesulfobacteriota bacterium]